MAITLAPKPYGAIYLYTWKPSLNDGDAISSYTLTPNETLVVESSENANYSINFYVSGGQAGTVYTISGTIVTDLGETIKETFYIPVAGPGNSFAYTADDIIDFALRPAVGLGGTRTSSETADALEILNDMVADWADQGAELGIPVPMTTASVIYCSDAAVAALKNNLRVAVAEQYGRQVAPATAKAAVAGLQRVKFAKLRDRDPTKATYY